MAREPENYRDNLERVLKRFPNREILQRQEVAEFLGVTTRTLKKYFPKSTLGGIPIVALAKKMSE